MIMYLSDDEEEGEGEEELNCPPGEVESAARVLGSRGSGSEVNV